MRHAHRSDAIAVRLRAVCLSSVVFRQARLPSGYGQLKCAEYRGRGLLLFCISARNVDCGKEKDDVHSKEAQPYDLWRVYYYYLLFSNPHMTLS